MKSEVDRGFLTASKGFLGYPTIVVYCATPLAAAHGLLGNGEPMAPADRARALGRPSAAHDLAVQHYVASSASAAPGPVMEVQGFQHQPDALIDRHCVEIELTQKSDPRIFRTYLFYAHAIANDRINSVRFVFRSQSLADAYLARFAETSWVDSQYNADRRKYVRRDPFLVEADHALRPRFEFVTESALWPFPKS